MLVYAVDRARSVQPKTKAWSSYVVDKYFSGPPAGKTFSLSLSNRDGETVLSKLNHCQVLQGLIIVQPQSFRHFKKLDNSTNLATVPCCELFDVRVGFSQVSGARFRYLLASVATGRCLSLRTHGPKQKPIGLNPPPRLEQRLPNQTETYKRGNLRQVWLPT